MWQRNQLEVYKAVGYDHLETVKLLIKNACDLNLANEVSCMQNIM
jgi:hypothetical protein